MTKGLRFIPGTHHARVAVTSRIVLGVVAPLLHPSYPLAREHVEYFRDVMLPLPVGYRFIEPHERAQIGDLVLWWTPEDEWRFMPYQAGIHGEMATGDFRVMRKGTHA